MDAAEINRRVIAQFRAGGEVEGMRRSTLLLLTTTGSVSGEPRTTPMMFVAGERGPIVIASNNGAPTAPRWYRNLRADARVEIETPDGGRSRAHADELQGSAREAAWDRLVTDYPFFVEHERRAGRRLPLVELAPA